MHRHTLMTPQPPLVPGGLAKPAETDFVFFYGGPFSQWTPCRFTVDGIEYNCAEQYMMAQKARLFGDMERLELIMASSDPSEQKALGKRVWPFKKETWEAVARDVVMRGNLAKFTSGRKLYDALMSTGEAVIVEASPTDRIWGIGLGEYDDARLDPRKWDGSNWLGQALMDVRDQLRLASAWEVYR